MSFLNALLLGGTAAGALPLVIHLLQRRKRQTVRWGAMQFLLLKNRSQRRKFNLEQWLLLLLRICIPVLLALCMARPLLSSLSPASDQTPLSLVCLLDDSASMGSREDEKSPASIAAKACELAIQALPRGSEVSLIPLSNPEVPIAKLTVDTAGAARALRQFQNQLAPAQISAGLDAAADTLSHAHQKRRRVVLCSDFQKSNWSSDEADLRKMAAQRLQTQQPVPSLFLFDAGAPGGENVAVESVAFPKLPLGIKQKWGFTATLRNYGSKPRPQTTLEWKVDGAFVTSSTVSIGAHESVQAVFEHAFNEPGPHTVEAITDRDSQPSDDAFFTSILVHDPLEVLIINGHPSPEPMQGESDFLEIALRPKTASGGEGAGMLKPTVAEANSINAKTIAHHKIVILADVRLLSRQQVVDLEEFVRGGGGLLVFPGRQSEVEWYNKTLHASGLGLLPARIDSLQTTSPAGAAATIGTNLTRHPVLEPFTRSDAAFDEIRISNWYSLKLPERDLIHKDTAVPSTILSLDKGEPLFIERAFGSGTVIQSALPCSAAWSNLPARPVYLPLFQRLTLHAGLASNPDLILPTGKPILASFQTKSSIQTAWVKSPDDRLSEVITRRKDSGDIVEFNNTFLPGIYELCSSEGDARRYALNVSRAESDPLRLDDAEIQAIAKQLEASLTTAKEDLLRPDSNEMPGREVWRPLLWVTLLLVFAEIFLTQNFATSGKHIK
jgi:hypothetical protein